MDEKQRLEEIVELTNQKLDELLACFEGKEISDIRQFIILSQVELNPTKRKLAEVLEMKLSQKVDEQKLSI